MWVADRCAQDLQATFGRRLVSPPDISAELGDSWWGLSAGMTVHPSLAIVGSYAASLLHEISNRDVATARCSELLASEPGGSLHICFLSA